jgi:hypothetical protein
MYDYFDIYINLEHAWALNGFQYLQHLKFRSHEQFMMIIFPSQKYKVPCENCKHHPYIPIVKCSKGDEK